MVESLKIAIAIIIDKSQQFLITQRALHASAGGAWEFPGGKLEINETPEMALKREVYEEVGLTCINYKLLGIVEDKHSFFVFHVQDYCGEANSCEDQLDLRWVLWEDLITYDFPAANANILKLLRRPMF